MSPILPLHPASGQPIMSGPRNGEGQAARLLTLGNAEVRRALHGVEPN